jgi:hypothetical protein
MIFGFIFCFLPFSIRFLKAIPAGMLVLFVCLMEMAMLLRLISDGRIPFCQVMSMLPKNMEFWKGDAASFYVKVLDLFVLNEWL